MWTRIIIGLTFIIGVGVGSVIMSDIWAGLLEPPPEAMDADGNPVPTTMDALDQLQGGQDQLQTDVDTVRLQPIDDGDIRFVNLADGRVLDHRTGLEWEQEPDSTTRTHANALTHCDELSLAGQDDWRLPERDELASLVDLDNSGGNPDLPLGHLFSDVQSSNYWSATSVVAVPANAWNVNFNLGIVSAFNKGLTTFVWCVR